MEEVDLPSEEEDYMSDTFLQQCQNVTPGLVPKHMQRVPRSKVENKSPKKKSNPIMPKKRLESHNLETGLNTEISSSSKGFLLLQKMGYKPGTGIGKSGEGRKEPIRIEVKSGREGLGAEMERKRKSLMVKEMRASRAAKKQKHSENQTTSFLARMKDRYAEKGLEKDFRISQSTCVQLDQQQGIVRPELSFFWPARDLPKSIKEEDETDDHIQESSSCTSPKVSIDDDDLSDDPDSEFYDLEDSTVDSDLSISDKLSILTTYLRDSYRYCIWCGTAYDDAEELKSQCPGNSADSHD